MYRSRTDPAVTWWYSGDAQSMENLEVTAIMVQVKTLASWKIMNFSTSCCVTQKITLIAKFIIDSLHRCLISLIHEEAGHKTICYQYSSYNLYG